MRVVRLAAAALPSVAVRRLLPLLVLSCLAMPLGLWAQGNTMGTLSGKVIDPEGLPIPGVAITVSSTSLQGIRTATTSANGDYVLPLLPAGDYLIVFELEGFGTVKQTQRVTPGETTLIPAIKLVLASVSETVNVVGKVEDFAQTAAAATSLKSDLVQKLPTARNLVETVLLAPGVNNTGPSSGVTIAGALSYEGLYLVNGVVVNENLRGQPLNLFVEDAVQETTTTTGSVSAEYGRFAGGVVNTITKSGGNTFSGSFRDALANDSWRSVTPFGEPKTDKTVPTYTYTFGGPIWRDKLWFFHAGRYTKTATSMVLPYSGFPLDQSTKEYRLEETLRYSLTPNHNFRATMFNLASEQNNYRFNGMDLRQIYDRRLPQDMQSLNYNAILSNRLFLELQYSRRALSWENDGARYTDRIRGTQLQDRSKTSYWSPTFCGVCTNEQRNNQDVLAKASYFLSTSKTGSHNLVAGADVFKDYRYSNNHQSGSDFTVASPRSIQVGNDFYPVLTNDGLTLITYRPILVPTKGTNIWTYSAFFNDAWRLNSHFSFNLGVRWDRNRSVDGSGTEVAKDAMFSPRLSATWDPRGDGKTTFFTSYARYVASIANSIADAGSAGGVAAAFQWVYRGPAVNTDGPVLLPDAALPIMFAWWDAQGGANNPNLNGVNIPGLSTRVGAGLKAGYMTEYLAGMSHNFGRVLVRVDASYRPASNFYGNFTNLALGRVTHEPTGLTADVTEVRNTDTVWRKYWGVNGQFSWRPRRDLTVGGNWTISRNRGNVEGENTGSGPIRATVDQYPEYKAPEWNYPVGDLSSDQRHRGRLFANYDRPLGRFGSLGIAVLQMANSGTPYGATGNIDMRRYVANPGYATAQGGSTVQYFFTERDAFRLPWVYRTDLSLNYSYKFGRRYEVFWQGQLLNAFDATRLATLGNINTTVMTADVPGSITGLQRFNALTTEPVQGVNWVLDPGTSNRDGHGNPVPFGQALAYSSYQTPRTFRTSFGFRF